MEQTQKTGRGHCPHCRDGFVIREAQRGPTPPGHHCLICGWERWDGFEIRKPAKHETLGKYPEQVKISHKKMSHAEKELRQAMRQGVRA